MASGSAFIIFVPRGGFKLLNFAQLYALVIPNDRTQHGLGWTLATQPLLQMNFLLLFIVSNFVSGLTYIE